MFIQGQCVLLVFVSLLPISQYAMLCYTVFAVLSCAVLCCSVLCRAVLCCAVLCCAVLCCAGLCCAVLCCAVLCCAASEMVSPAVSWMLANPGCMHKDVYCTIRNYSVCNKSVQPKLIGAM